jgi:uncharacterized repeat protein (TIGR01451 family)
MKKLLSMLKNKYTLLAIVSVVAVGTLFSNGLQFAKSDTCPGNAPESAAFNIWPLSYDGNAECHDRPLIDARNASTNGAFSTSQAEHDNGVAAKAGDEIVVNLYYHNGATPDPLLLAATTAKNVFVSSVFDTASGTDHTLFGEINSDNTASARSSSAGRGGNIVVHTDTATTLQFVPGSITWYPKDGPTKTMPNPANGASDGVVNVGIGNILACFPHAGQIVYKLKVVGATVTPPVNPGTPNLVIEKLVRNTNRGGSPVYTKQVNAQINDQVDFQIKVKNTGTADAKAVVLRDVLPAGLTFVANNAPASLVGTGVNLGDIGPGAESTTLFSATVNVNQGTLVNTAIAKGSNTNEVSDTATVVVSPVVITPPVNPTITLDKTVRNTARGFNSYVKQVNAQTGDTVEYQIVVANNSNDQANDVKVVDNSPTGIEYISGSANTPLVSGAFVLGNIAAHSSKTITYSAKVTGGQGTYTNVANATSSNAPSPAPSSAVVIVPPVITDNFFPQLSIEKCVRNLTFPGSNTSFNPCSHFTSAFQNDHVAFQVTVNSTGTRAVDNVVVKDILPAGLSFVSGSVRIDNNNATNAYDNLVNTGISFGSMAPNTKHTIYFEAIVNASAGAILQNVAQATSSNYQTIQDQATVSVGGVNGGNVNLVFHKSARNDSAASGNGVTAVSCNNGTTALCLNAGREDFITYTLTVQNTGNAASSSFVVTDDLSQVLNYASMVDLNGGTLNGNVISWPGEVIPAGGTITKTFRVRVNFFLPQVSNLTLTNTYGNQVIVKIVQPQVLGAVLVAPKTGASATAGIVFAGLLTVAFAFMKRKGYINTLLNAVPSIKIQ